MLEKAVRCNKSVILLRWFCLTMTVVMVISLSAPVHAEDIFPLNIYDYNDFVQDVVVDGDNDIVTVALPVKESEWQLYGSDGNRIARAVGSGSFSWYANPVDVMQLYAYPYGSHNRLGLDNIPTNTTGSISFSVNFSGGHELDSLTCDLYYCDSEGNILRDTHFSVLHLNEINGVFTTDFEINKQAGETCVMLRLHWSGIHTYEPVECEIILLRYELKLSISSLYRDGSVDTALLEEISRQLAAQGKTLEDLAGDIGDEMQGVIDHEKQESESSGNKFVDQILGALPDPSQDVLASLKSLTDATAYTGTDAVLPIPAIVLPAIDGLFEETVIWDGTEFDFGEYLGIIPSSLLTLVQSLFTIAIVLFCVYELKGIISYCLTLRENKGG